MVIIRTYDCSDCIFYFALILVLTNVCCAFVSMSIGTCNGRGVGVTCRTYLLLSVCVHVLFVGRCARPSWVHRQCDRFNYSAGIPPVFRVLDQHRIHTHFIQVLYCNRLTQEQQQCPPQHSHHYLCVVVVVVVVVVQMVDRCHPSQLRIRRIAHQRVPSEGIHGGHRDRVMAMDAVYSSCVVVCIVITIIIITGI